MLESQTVLPLQFQTEALTLAPGRTMEFTAETLLTDGAEIEVLQVLNAQAEGEGLSVSPSGQKLTLTAAADAPPGASARQRPLDSTPAHSPPPAREKGSPPVLSATAASAQH